MSTITIYVCVIGEHMTKISISSTGTFEDIVRALLDNPDTHYGNIENIIFNGCKYEIPKCNEVKLQDVGMVDNSKIIAWFDTQIGYITSHHFYSKAKCGLTFSHPLNELIYSQYLQFKESIAS